MPASKGDWRSWKDIGIVTREFHAPVVLLVSLMTFCEVVQFVNRSIMIGVLDLQKSIGVIWQKKLPS